MLLCVTEREGVSRITVQFLACLNQKIWSKIPENRHDAAIGFHNLHLRKRGGGVAESIRYA
jgi:hypothetical protein